MLSSYNGSFILAKGIKLLNNDIGSSGVRAWYGSTVIFTQSEVTNILTGGSGCYAFYNSSIECSFSELTINEPALLAARGSKIMCAFGTISTSGTSDEIRVFDGSTIVANDTTGSINQTVNTITSDGIIFQ